MPKKSQPPKGTPTTAPPPSGPITVDPLVPADDRLVAIKSHPNRWRAPAVAAALALPSYPDLTVEQWTALLDGLERGISLVVDLFTGTS